MIYPHKPLMERQVCIKSHDCFYSSKLSIYRCQMYELRMLKRPPWMQPPPPRQGFGFRVRPQKQRLRISICRRGVQRNVGLYRTRRCASRNFLSSYLTRRIPAKTEDKTGVEQMRARSKDFKPGASVERNVRFNAHLSGGKGNERMARGDLSFVPP